MISVKQAHFLRTTSSKELVEDFGNYTREKFSAEGIPVLVAARNEQEDLPATLLSLANSSIEVNPIIIENESDDETALRARKMGAHIINSQAKFKLEALQEGLGYLKTKNQLNNPVLFTDADTLVGKNWAAVMSRLSTSYTGAPRVVSGLAIFEHGKQMRTDTVRTLNGIAKDALIFAGKREATGRGHNMAVHFTNNEALDAYTSLDKTLFIGEEKAIIDAMVRCGGDVIQSLSLHALVLTRGDRFNTLKDCLSVRDDSDFTERKQLYSEYQDFTPYVVARQSPNLPHSTTPSRSRRAYFYNRYSKHAPKHPAQEEEHPDHA